MTKPSEIPDPHGGPIKEDPAVASITLLTEMRGAVTELIKLHKQIIGADYPYPQQFQGHIIKGLDILRRTANGLEREIAKAKKNA